MARKGKRYANAARSYDSLLAYGPGEAVELVKSFATTKFDETVDVVFSLVGGKVLAEEIANGRALDFDLMIATPDMMAEVGKLGRVLGPRGLMPNPKAGTVTADVGKAVSEFKAGKLEYRNDRYGNVHIPIGKASFDAEALRENLVAIGAEIVQGRPAAAKGRFIKNVSISSTMGPGVKVDSARLVEVSDD